jgi:hypothetical protein
MIKGITPTILPNQISHPGPSTGEGTYLPCSSMDAYAVISDENACAREASRKLCTANVE